MKLKIGNQTFGGFTNIFNLLTALQFLCVSVSISIDMA